MNNSINTIEGIAEPDRTLNSWKEIATYFNRGVRTVQRWERELGVPIHRIRETEHSPVFAFASELRQWVETRAAIPNRQVVTSESAVRRSPNSTIVRCQAIVSRTRELTRQLANLVAEHNLRASMLNHSLRTILGIKPWQMQQKRTGELVLPLMEPPSVELARESRPVA